MANRVVYILELQDKYSRVAAKVNAASVKMERTFARTAKSVKHLSKEMNKAGHAMRSAGKAAQTSSLVATGLIANSIRLWDKQATSVAQVEAALKSTGSVAGFTLQQLKAEASALQGTSLYGDEEILQGVTAQLLTFKNISGDTFKRTQKAVMDLSTRMKIDLKSSAIQLGKALNDPSTGLSMLTRVGITFTDSQKTTIKGLQAAGRAAEAQAIILAELESQYKGSAKAAAEAGAGPFKQLWNILGDIQEVIGGVIGTALLPMVAKIKELAVAFQNASPWVHKLTAIVVVLVAVIAPLLSVLGFVMIGLSALVPVAGAVAGAFAILSSAAALAWFTLIAPIAIIVGAIWLVWDNWSSIVALIGESIDWWASKLSGVFEKIEAAKNFLGFGDTETNLNNNVTQKTEQAALLGADRGANRDEIVVTVNAAEGATAEAKPVNSPQSSKALKVGVNNKGSL